MSNESEVSNWKYSHFLKNEKNNFSKNDILSVLPKHDMDEAYKIISKWDNYSPTPLISLNKLSEKLGLNKIFYNLCTYYKLRVRQDRICYLYRVNQLQ